jgi:hypothetical protein
VEHWWQGRAEHYVAFRELTVTDEHLGIIVTPVVHVCQSLVLHPVLSENKNAKEDTAGLLDFCRERVREKSSRDWSTHVPLDYQNIGQDVSRE